MILATRKRPGPLPDLRDGVVRRLEDAGRTLAMLPIPKNGRPAPPGCAWPDVVQSFWDVVGHAEVGTIEDRQHLLAMANNQPIFRADRAAITRLDEVLGWLWLVSEPHKRRVVAARMLVHPVSLRHRHSWGEVADGMNTSSRSVRRWFEDGVEAIIRGLAVPPKK